MILKTVPLSSWFIVMMNLDELSAGSCRWVVKLVRKRKYCSLVHFNASKWTKSFSMFNLQIFRRSESVLFGSVRTFDSWCCDWEHQFMLTLVSICPSLPWPWPSSPPRLGGSPCWRVPLGCLFWSHQNGDPSEMFLPWLLEARLRNRGDVDTFLLFFLKDLW